MTASPRPLGPDTVAKLASWLSVHLADPGQSVAEVARDLGVSEATVRSWLAGRRPEDGGGEFAHLDTPAKLGAWLRARIIDSGCTVRQIAETTAHVSRVTIYYWIRGEHLPRPPTGDEPDRFDLVLSNPRLGLSLRERVQLDEVRRRLTGTSLHAAGPSADWPDRGLPAGDRAFTGRNEELRRLDRLLREHQRGRAAVIAALTGIGGVGKTALAVHWARSRAVRARFTDGCLYLNLNGFADVPPTSPEQALTGLLEQLGVDPRAVPTAPDALAAQYRESLRGKRLLIVLDNARAEPQVRPLLPAEEGCLVVITSRNRLDGLRVTHAGVVTVALDALIEAEAASLVRNLLGRLTVKGAGEEEIAAFTAACGRLPLAIQIAAADYLNHHARSTAIGAYARALAGDRLGHLTVGPNDPSTSVAAVMDRSYLQLSAAARRTYRLLGLHPGPDVTAAQAAALTGLGAADTRAALMELTRANLLAEDARARCSFHDLLRDHAAALAARTDTGAERRAAMRRLLDHYVHTAYPAAVLIQPSTHELALPLGEPSEGAAPEAFAEREAAMAWFEAEHPGMTATALHQPPGAFDVQVWQSAWALFGFFSGRGHLRTQIALQRAALGAAERLDEPVAQAHSHRLLAWSDTRLGRFADSRAHLMRALKLSGRAGDLVGQAATYNGLAILAGQQGDHAEALDHAWRFLKLFEAAGSGVGVARGLNAVGCYLAELGRYTEALGYCERSADACQGLDAGFRLPLEAHVWDSLGLVHHRLGDFEQARFHYQRALDRHRELRERLNEGETLAALGDLHRSAGDPDAARAAWREASVILADLEHVSAAEVQGKLAALDA
ncbi:tetratricopeptide repeat protein [Glycomyces tritici]|uniref:Tetratricopeptide repeat protein n=1 Tax=Glycomyces tritici TaxID=2665176 RepID=A0ABT7YX44_9ACTN|nr:tetratricopeptide repeat protein [Glycomyces tritici]MDN3242944.1 tetratricopeptide repeat protein [Glycomyces tritici]